MNGNSVAISQSNFSRDRYPMQFLPSTVVAPYIKNYTVVTIDNDLDNEVFYPSGYVDIVINISGSAATIINGRKKDTPAIELLGHLTLPTRLSVAKGTVVLIARIYPYAAALFFSNTMAVFTNYATDMSDIASSIASELYDRMMHAVSISEKVDVLDHYFAAQLAKNEQKIRKVNVVRELCNQLASADDFHLPLLAKKMGMSERYIQQLYIANVGINPASFVAVARFNKSLHLMRTTQASLTDIAYECGYYDQAYFIHSFKKLTGITPSQAKRSFAKNDQAFQQAVNIGF